MEKEVTLSWSIFTGNAGDTAAHPFGAQHDEDFLSARGAPRVGSCSTDSAWFLYLYDYSILIVILYSNKVLIKLAASALPLCVTSYFLCATPLIHTLSAWSRVERQA